MTPTHKPLMAGDPFGPMLLDSLFRLLKEDMEKAIATNSEYRELAAKQWATLLAKRAFEFMPSLRG